LKATTRAHLSVFVVNLIYAANFSIAKLVMPEYVKPFAFIVLRVVPATILFFIISWMLPKERVRKEDKYFMVLGALFGVAVNQLLFFKGLSLTSPINGALIMTTNPVLVLMMAAFFLKEHISWNKILGIALGIAGAFILILLGSSFHIKGGNTEGDIYVFLNSVSFAYFIVMAKPLMCRYHPITIMKWIFFFGSLMVFPFGYPELKQVEWSAIPLKIWLCIAFVVFFVTFIAYLMNVFALKELSPSQVSIYIYLQPVFATLISMMIGEGKPGWLHLISAVMIFVGVYLVSRQKIEGVNRRKQNEQVE